jgi:periplasmic protein TonB
MKLLVTSFLWCAVFGAVACEAQTAAGPVTTAPVLIKEVKPLYAGSALAERQQGQVLLALRVERDGTVGKVRVTKHLSRELDAAAIAAARQWRFKPGTKNGRPVAVETAAEMTFALR